MVTKLIDTSIAIMRNHAVNADRVNWTELRQIIAEKTKSTKHPYELGDIYRDIFRRLGDYHGGIFVADSTYKWTPHQIIVNDSIKKEWLTKVYLLPQVIAEKIGYIRIPSMSNFNREDGNALAQNLYDSLCYLLNQNVHGLVIDLRLNGGGSMHPMILGVAPLLGQGRIGSFYTLDREDWVLTGNSLIVGKDTSVSIKIRDHVDARKTPVVVLTSPITGSSAEFFIMAFKGRGKTVLLGSKTAGYTTVTRGFQIDDYSSILLSVGYGADRTGKIYKSALMPDISIVDTDKFNDLINDEKIRAAVKWLKSQMSD